MRQKKPRNKCALECCDNLLSRASGKYCSVSCLYKSRKGRIVWNVGQRASDETKQKMSLAHKGNQCAKGTKRTPEQLERLKARRKPERFPLTDETKGKIRASLKDYFLSGNKPSFLGRTHTPETRMKLSLYSTQLSHKWTKHCKVSYPFGIYCQSSSESAFIEMYYDYFVNVLSATIKRGTVIKTPFGFYMPDFHISSELGDSYIEIKSDWTIKTLFTRNIRQLQKINWINENTDMQVHIIVT